MADAQLEKVRAERAATRAALRPRRGGKDVDFTKCCGQCQEYADLVVFPLRQGECRMAGLRLASEVACTRFLDKAADDC